MFEIVKKRNLDRGIFQAVIKAYSEKENPSFAKRSPAYDVPITSSDALPLSYRRRVGAKAIKLGSCDKHPAYCWDLNFDGYA